MNLIEIAKKYKDKLYKDDNELKKDLDKIKIFIPITSSTIAEVIGVKILTLYKSFFNLLSNCNFGKRTEIKM